MIRGIYNSASGMITQKRRLDVAVNNLANSTTPGFKEDRVVSSSFSELYLSRLDDFDTTNNSRVLGSKSFGVGPDDVVTSFDPGNLHETGLYTDLSLQGDGFFVIDTQSGPLYTKSGNFTVSGDGILVTQEGNPVMGEQGVIRVGNGEFTVDASGEISSENGTFRLLIAGFEDNSLLRKQGDNLYHDPSQQPIYLENPNVKQGFLESSNVDLVRQMVDMIDITRSFEINQRMLKIQDERLGKSVNEIGRL